MESIPDLGGLGTFVRQRRQALGLTQRELGERIDWVQERVSLLERGGYGLPSLIILARLATALETPLSALIGALGYEAASPAVERESPNCGVLLYTLERFLAIPAVALRPVLSESCDVTARVMGADMVESYLYEPEKGQLVSCSCSTTPLGQRQRKVGLDSISLDDGGRIVDVFKTGQPFMTGSGDELRQIFHCRLGVESLLAARIDFGDSYFGVLVAESTHRDRFSGDELHFFLAVAHWVGLIAERARLVQEPAGA